MLGMNGKTGRHAETEIRRISLEQIDSLENLLQAQSAGYNPSASPSVNRGLQ